MKSFFLAIVLLAAFTANAQIPDHIYYPNIKMAKLYAAGNPLAYPVMHLNSGDKVELHFDDLDPQIRNYSYTYQLCNSDWVPAAISQFDYIKGFSAQRISNYRMSSVALTKYIHYQAVLPEANCVPSRSGNYLVKIFADGDTSKLLFTKRLLVLEDVVPVGAQVQQPFNGQYFKTHQKIQLAVNTSKLDLVNPAQQLNVCILQNNRWDNYIHNLKPTFIHLGSLEFNAEEDALFPGGREWRWLDLRNFHLQSDRVAHADYGKNNTDIFVTPDGDRSQQRFITYKDNDGMYFNDVSESINPFWQADYASVHFLYVPPGKIPYTGKDLYLFGELTGYGDAPQSKMVYNEEKGVYETTLMLKQGYYDYCYVTTDKNAPAFNASFNFTEGNFWETENTYTVLIYYRSLGDRADRLVGLTRVNSLTSRSGL